MSDHKDSQIAKFFAGKTIFLTGATGFLGKVLLEKLLRVCYDLDKIYILVRPKKGKGIEQRFKEIFDFACFDNLKRERDDYRSKLRLISGDCNEINLGLTENDRNLLINDVEIVIHAAAIVKFDQDLRTAANINVRSVKDVISLAKSMPKLKVFVHVSTAYAFCPIKEINEIFYNEPMSAKKLFNILDSLDDTTLNNITPQYVLLGQLTLHNYPLLRPIFSTKLESVGYYGEFTRCIYHRYHISTLSVISLLGKWPNTYVFTKAIAEGLIRDEMVNLPATIVRPAIVCCSVEEPMPGWIDNFYGAIGIVVAASLGVLRSLNAKPDAIAQLVPVDYVANCVLASTWDIATTTNQEGKIIPIYNYTGWNNNLITWQQFNDYIYQCAWNYPTKMVVWYYCFALRANPLWHKMAIFFLHTVPACIVDMIFIILGKPPIALKNYKKMDKMLSYTSYFSVNSWNFHYNNVENLWNKLNNSDKKLFKFTMENINWSKWIEDSVIGGRIYLLKDPLETIPEGKRKIKLLTIAHYFLLTIMGLIFIKFINLIVNYLFFL